jgi:NAD(P)H-dependent FMN reductase
MPRKLSLSPGASIVGVVGNPKALSRTHQMVTAVAEAVASAYGGRVDAVIDLVELKPWLLDWGAPQVGRALEQVVAADVLVVGSRSTRRPTPGC